MARAGLAVNKEADGHRRNGKNDKNATDYHTQPNGPAAVVLDNLRVDIGHVPSRHRTSLKAIEVCFGAPLRCLAQRLNPAAS
jgi:hypothetical protein